MKSKITALALIAVTALSLAPKPAVANDRTLAVIGGFIGGVIVASELNHNYGYAPAPAVVVNDRCDEGYWTEVNVRFWVPGCWVSERGHHGRSYRRYAEGHYEYRRDRVWVARDHRDGRDRDDDYRHRR
jgi:hypothetical protein